jgi:hypothetical protein
MHVDANPSIVYAGSRSARIALFDRRMAYEEVEVSSQYLFLAKDLHIYLKISRPL